MKLILAKSAGFCFGVSRAVNMAYDSLSNHDNIYTLGPIIHNPQVVDELDKKGVKVIEDIANLPEKCAVVIRSHGVAPDVYKQLNDKNITILDATCPYVKRIHETVQKHHEMGYDILIVGEREHPEVMGISGWADGKCHCINSVEDAEKLDNINPEMCCVVAQTTSSMEKWEKIVHVILKSLPKAKIFCTICTATSKRQTEAVEVAQKADAMLVIGGKNSSNTQKLVDICRKYCPSTYAVERIEDVPDVSENKIVGITAGASTPDWLIKEVITKMSEIKLAEEETNFAEEMDKMFVSIRNGQLVKGTIVLLNNNEVCVNIGYKSDGIIPASELVLPEGQDIMSQYKVGDEIEAEVVRVNDGEGNVLLSIKRIASKAALNKLAAAMENDEVFEATIKKVVKGGLRAEYEGVGIFIPASQIRTENNAELDSLIGQTVKLKVLEVDRARKSVVASNKKVFQAERAERLEKAWSNIAVGEKITGTVRRITDFGVFVDIGGVDGMIYIGDLAWYHVSKATDVVNIGDTIEVVVLAADREKNRISLGLKQLTAKPWDNVTEKYPVDSVVTGTVVRIAAFGAFVQLEPGVDGLVHISQLAYKRVARVDEVVKVGDEVQAVVLEVNEEDKKISLSIKATLPEPAEEIAPEEASDEE